MNCPKCGAESKVIDSRPALDTIRRRRECTECGHRFTTREIPHDQWDILRAAQRLSDALRLLSEASRGTD